MARFNSNQDENQNENPCDLNPSPADPSFKPGDIGEENTGTTIEPDGPATQSGNYSDPTTGKDSGV